MRQLTLDIGNTRDKLALFEDGVLILTEKASPRFTPSSLRQIVRQYKPLKGIYCQTGNAVPDTLNGLSEVLPLLELSHTVRLPFELCYETPQTLGRDRIALVAGAYSPTRNRPALVIDAGTCITLDLLDAEARYQGGIIAPGIRMRLEAMHTFTARLPLVHWDGEIRDMLVGKSTEGSLLSGAFDATAAELDGLMDRFSAQYPGLEVLLTGGDGPALASSLKNRIFAAPHLLMEGLNKILTYNEL